MLTVHRSVNHQPPCFGKSPARSLQPAAAPARVRRVYLCFDYHQDLARINRIRQIPGVAVNAPAGFKDASYWNSIHSRGEVTALRAIDAALENTSVTVVCLDRLTSSCKYVMYVVEHTLDLGHGLVGVHIHNVRDARGNTSDRGSPPWLIKISGFKVYDYTNQEDLAHYIEEAADLAGV